MYRRSGRGGNTQGRDVGPMGEQHEIDGRRPLGRRAVRPLHRAARGAQLNGDGLGRAKNRHETKNKDGNAGELGCVFHVLSWTNVVCN
ncbi:protein of unknown function [Thauera humireducens]|nr:protein of unknown function [Thauera humireducens]